jgi:hypothetical protein
MAGFLIADFPKSAGSRIADRSVAVSALGGTPRSLPGYAGRVIGTTDTVMVTGSYVPGRDTLVWLRIVTASDGLVRDSIAIRQPMLYQEVASGAARRSHRPCRLVGDWYRAPLAGSGRAGDGFAADVCLSHPPICPVGPPQADALVLQVELREGNPAFVWSSAVPAPFFLVRHQVSADGKFVGRTDTLMMLERGSQLANLRPRWVGASVAGASGGCGARARTEWPRPARLSLPASRRVDSGDCARASRETVRLFG